MAAPTTSPSGECESLGCNRPCARCAQRVATGFVPFETWPQVRAAAETGSPLWYHAPMDIAPVRVSVIRVYKNGGIRLRASDLTFTADAGHLDRFHQMV